MGLFDPPTRGIAKRVPASAQTMLVAVQSLAETLITEEVGRTKHSCLVAIVMGIWVNEHALAGTFDMSQRDLDYVRNMCMNCSRVARQEYWLTKPVMAKLIEAEMMPPSFKEHFEGH